MTAVLLLAAAVHPEIAAAGAVDVQMPAMVISAGYSDGSASRFFADGKELQVATGRGFNMVVLSENGSISSSHAFDTSLSEEAETLVELVGSLANGTSVMIAVQDDAADGLTDDVKKAIQSCGAKDIGELQWRSSFALLGVKGGRAMAEQVRAAGEGPAAVASLYGVQGVPGVDITAKSGGYTDGNFAEFSIDGSGPSRGTGKGWNAVLLWRNGTFRASMRFDTEAHGSEELVDTVSGLETGSVMILAVQDDGKVGLSAEATAALGSLGAMKLGHLRWRSSYALVGVKGHAALAEAVSAEGEGSVELSTRYGGPVGAFMDLRPTTTTLTTTSMAPMCGQYECGDGMMHKMDAWNISGSSDASCCEDAAEGIVSIVVRSAGYGNGNVAEFYLNGGRLSAQTRRGINVIELRADGTAKRPQSFDTHGQGSADLVTYLDDLANGTHLLFADRDEASANLTDAALSAMEACGAREIRNLTYRGAYALIGTKGGVALAEQLRADGEGYAVVSAHLEVDASSAQSASSKPLCQARTAHPPVRGWMSNGQLELDEGCRYSLFEPEGVAGCLSGGWMVIIGGSNTVLMAIRLANMLAPDAILPARDAATMGGFTVVDVIIDGGEVKYRAARLLEGCTALRRNAACQAKIDRAVAEAPAPSGSAIRITLLSAQFWDHAASGLQAVEASGGAWLSQRMAFLAQVSTWDIYCAGMKVSWCPRKDLNDKKLSQKDAMEMFRSDMEPVLAKLQGYCGPSGAAAELGCVIGTTKFQNPSAARIPIYEAYNDAIRSAMAPLASEAFRLVDFWVLGQAMPDENVLGHGSPVENLWDWQVMLSGMCAANFAADGTAATFEGELCFGDQAKRNAAKGMPKCPDYRAACPKSEDCPECSGHHLRCEPWECANSLRCALVPSIAGPEPDTDGLREHDFRPDFASAAQTQQGREACHRIWCAPDLEFLPAICAAALAVLIALGQQVPLRKIVQHCPRRGAVGENKGKAADNVESGATDTAAAPATTPGVASAEAEQAASAAVAAVGAGEAATDQQSGPARERSSKEEADPAAAAVAAATAALASGPADDSKGAQKEPAAGGRKKAGDKFPLGLARFCASLHVVVGHLYAKGATSAVYFFGWGFTWVPWFFMLSGFVLFTAHLRRPKQEGVLEYVMRRSVGIYPLYAFSLIPAVILAKVSDKMPGIPVLVGQSFLLQAWWPAWTEHALQSHCWFLSAMVVYWLCFRPLSRCLQGLGLAGTLGLMGALFSLPWLVILVPVLADEPVRWYAQHSWGETGSLLDLAVVFLKFHPLCYLHVFVLGMLLAKLRLLLDAKAAASSRPGRWTLPMEFVAPLGYLGLGLVFFVPSLCPLAFKLSARLSVLLPFQAAVLFGLAGLPSMPAPRAAELAAHFNFLENYSYAVYVFQFICYSLWPQSGKVSLPWFLLFCVSTAFIMATLVQKHVQGWWGRHPKGRMLVPLAMSLLLIGISLLPVADHNPDLPASVRLDTRMLDMRLPLVDSEGSTQGHLMNPSLAVSGSHVLVVARRHSYEVEQHNGEYRSMAVVVEDRIWHSQILLSEAPLDSEAWAQWPTTGTVPFRAELKPWQWLHTLEGADWSHLCVAETYDPVNNTVIHKVVTGPEDAKIFVQNGSVSIAFDSLPPLGEKGCNPGEEVSQMYLASSVHLDDVREVGGQPMRDTSEDVGRHLQCGETDVAEKNWIPFDHAGQLHFVYSPSPHEIVTASADGSCQTVYTTDFAPLQRLRRNNSKIEIRGSGEAVLVNDTAATPLLPKAHYLAVMHMVEGHSYAHFAYRFSAEPPFNILQVSSQLPLLPAEPAERGGPAFAFVSGLTVVGRTVAISYGAGDRDVRALVLTMDRLDEMFAA